MTRAEPKNPFYWLRELAQDALLLHLPTPFLKVMATTLARRADEDYFGRTGELISWIGADNLAKAIGFNRRTVQRGLIWLLEHGVVTKWEKGGGRKRSTRYCFSKQWLGAAAVELEKSGQAKAYGMPDDLFAFADGHSLTAVSAQFSGLGTANEAGGAEAAGQNYGVRTANRGQNSGQGTQVSSNYGPSTAVVRQNSGPISKNRDDTAVSGAEYCGLGDTNCGPIAPPEIDLNNRNKTPASRKTATGHRPDPNQLHWHHALPGGKAAAVESDGSAGSGMFERRLAPLIPLAVEILGDENRAALAVSWLEEDQKRKVFQGYRPDAEVLGRWLGWALDRADDAGDSAVPSHSAVPSAGELPPHLAQAMKRAAREAFQELLPAVMPDLARELLHQMQRGGNEPAGGESAAA